jgi:hypothetical protein
VLKELSSDKNVAFFLCSKISPMKKVLFLKLAKMTPDYAQFHHHEKMVPLAQSVNGKKSS